MNVAGAFSADECTGESVKWSGNDSSDIVGFLRVRMK
jgi:hypothetical protein